MNYQNGQSQMPQPYNPYASYIQQPARFSQMPNMPQNLASPYNAQPVQMPQQFSYATAPQPQSDIHWVQGSSGAKAYNLEPGRSALLMDSETNKFYIKSTDQSGMPLPLRTFRYTEEAEEVENQKSATGDMSQYVTKEDFRAMLEEYLGPLGPENKK